MQASQDYNKINEWQSELVGRPQNPKKQSLVHRAFLSCTYSLQRSLGRQRNNDRSHMSSLGQTGKHKRERDEGLGDASSETNREKDWS